MRLTLTFVLTLALAAPTGCAGASREESPQTATTAPDPAAQNRAAGGGAGATAEGTDGYMKTVSLQQTDDATTAPSANAPAVERKIIRNATLTLEVEQPTKAMQVIASIAESRGGFVVTSDSVRHVGTKGSKSYEVVTVEIRVPSAQFDAALAEIRAAAGSVTAQKITGKDVTEEYIDLEARLRTQKALEAQLMEIMKRAEEVEDAISVQRELTNVRTEIERVEGRRRFLENQSSLSTISVTLQPPAPLIGTTGFFQGVGAAFGEGIDIAAAVTLFLIRVLLALLPIALFLGLPAYFILRYFIRRARLRPAPPLPPQPVQEFQPQPPPNA
ncbi:MAG TPA: DUF4349 domain-containing protein [Pyrinomonadaceae bacterium]